MNEDKSNRRNWDRRRTNKRPIERRVRTPPRVYGRDVKDIDISKMKKITIEAIERSKYNNMLVRKLAYYNKSGMFCTINEGLLSIFTLTPSKPLIDCDHIRLKVTKGPEDDKKQENITRICVMNHDQPEICRLTNEKIKDGKCFGKKSYVSSHEFWVVTNGTILCENEKTKFKVGFFNCNIPNGYTDQEFEVNPDKQKAESLRDLYEKMKVGIISSPTIPKPGNLIFHTLLSGEVDVNIQTILGELIIGKIKGYNLTPGGTPSLNVLISENILKVIPLYIIESMIANDYKINDILRRRALAMLMNGHIVIPHAGNNTIYDYCKAAFKGKEQAIGMDGNIVPRDMVDRHDMEIDKIIKETK